MTLVISLIRANRKTLQTLHLRISHKQKVRAYTIIQPFTDLKTIENVNLGLIKTITSCRDLKNLTIPVFFYNPSILEQLSKMLTNLTFLQTLTFFSISRSTIVLDLPIGESTFTKIETY